MESNDSDAGESECSTSGGGDGGNDCKKSSGCERFYSSEESPVKRFKQHLYFDASLYKEGISCSPLYDGAPVTVLETLVHYFTWFSEHPGISEEALSSMLSMQHNSILNSSRKSTSKYVAMMLPSN